MTFLQLYDDQLDIELASSDLTQLFTTARRKQAVNDAMQEFVRLTGCTKKYGEIPITDGDGEYKIHVSLTDFRRLAGDPSIRIVDGADTRYIQGAKDFPRRTKELLDLLDPGWRAADASTPTAWYLTDDTGDYVLGATPAPSIDIGEVWDWIVPYVAKPTTMVSTTSEPFTVGGTVMIRLEDYHQALVHKAAALLEALRKNTTAIDYQEKKFLIYVAQYLKDAKAEGQDQIILSRNYFAESARLPVLDPRRYP